MPEPQAKKFRLFRKDNLKSHQAYARILNTAIRSNRRWKKDRNLHLTYTKANGDTVSRKVKPMSAKGNVLVAHDHDRNAIRSFRIDRIQKMEKETEKTAFWKGFERGGAK